MGKASLKATMVSIGEAIEDGGKVAGTTSKVAGMVDEATRVTKETLEAPKKYMGVTDEAAKMVEVGYGIVTVAA